MVRPIVNGRELNTVVENIARRVMEDSSKEILKKFKEYVVKYAYSGDPKVYNNPSGNEFLDAWDWSEIERVTDTLSMKMFNDWAKMTPGSRAAKNYIHSSHSINYADDTRQFLSEWLDRPGISKHWITGDRDGQYWTKFISEVFRTGELQRIIDKHAKVHGLVVTISVR